MRGDRRRSRRQRSGYILVYVLILIAMVAVFGATVAPTMAGVADQAKVTKTYAMLAEIDTGIVTFGTVVKRVGTVYPGAVHQLSTLMTTSDQVSCQNNSMNTNAINTWATKGPYISMYVPDDGLYTPLGVLDDSIEHPTAGGAMYIRIQNVDAAMAARLDGLVDNGDLGAAGTILYGTPTDGTVDLRYRVGYAPSFTLKNQC
jgi:type II secretory pathway pseudopilin PulG